MIMLSKTCNDSVFIGTMARDISTQRPTEVGGGGAPGGGVVTSLSSLPPLNLKRHATSVSDHIAEQMKDPGFKKLYDKCEIPTAEKNKKDLSQICECGLFPMHTVGYHKALAKSMERS